MKTKHTSHDGWTTRVNDLNESVKIPNKITKQVFVETDKKKNLVKAGDLKMSN